VKTTLTKYEGLKVKTLAYRPIRVVWNPACQGDTTPLRVIAGGTRIGQNDAPSGDRSDIRTGS